MTGNYVCKNCGRDFPKLLGLRVHSASCGKKKRKYTKRSAVKQPAKTNQLKQINDNKAVLTVPCTLAGNNFSVDISLSIVATSIYPV